LYVLGSIGYDLIVDKKTSLSVELYLKLYYFNKIENEKFLIIFML